MKPLRFLFGCFTLLALLAIFPSCSEDKAGKWQFSGEDWLEFGYVAVSDDGTVYAGTEDISTGNENEHSSYLYSISPDGVQNWNIYTSGSMSYPAIGLDGTVLVSNYDDKIFSLNTTGSESWSFEDPNVGADPAPFSHAIGLDGTVYLASRSNLYAIDEYGDLEWIVTDGGNHDTLEPDLLPPVIDSEGRIYAAFHYPGPGNSGIAIFAFNLLGVQEWFLEIEGEMLHHPPAIGPDSQLYASSTSRLYSINPDGGINWEFSYPATNTVTPLEPSQPVVDADGIIYLVLGYPYEDTTDGDDVTVVFALHATGAVKWELELNGSTSSTPVVGRDGKVYLASGSFLYSVLTDGTLDWSEDIKKNVSGIFPLTMGCDGTVYVSAREKHTLIAVETESPGPARSSWPMFGHDPRHTGNQATAICP